MDVASRGVPAKVFTCTAYNDAILLCNTQELVAAEKFLAVALTVSKYLSPEDSNIAKRVEQACAFDLRHTSRPMLLTHAALRYLQTLSHSKNWLQTHSR
jgi:hypothetical protein